MSKYILESADNIDWMAIGPLILFFIFFLLITYRAIRTKKAHIHKMERLPLEED